MALTATQRVATVMGNKRVVVATITFDSSYPTGGEDLTPGIVGLNTVEAVMPVVNGAEFAVYDYPTKKLKLFTADGTEATNASNQSTIVVTALIFGY